MLTRFFINGDTFSTEKIRCRSGGGCVGETCAVDGGASGKKHICFCGIGNQRTNSWGNHTLYRKKEE